MRRVWPPSPLTAQELRRSQCRCRSRQDIGLNSPGAPYPASAPGPEPGGSAISIPGRILGCEPIPMEAQSGGFRNILPV
ncbi:hypothetical protein L21SP2_0487 [Salinispira pacifica]|uniref:Uncharacterized protein n=1 Tax=Salinispira pacifica TaxID=1307761 RepID=V5WEC7_9SPIO|nr:hypothetical protein L21SP2_0487 [Salinispira pacifica]